VKNPIPWQLREGLAQVLSLPARLAASKSRHGIRRASGTAPVVSFGGVLQDGRLIHGGAVKLLHLRDRMASSDSEFNVLYLVSSAQPAFAGQLVDVCSRAGIPLVWNQNGIGYPGWAGGDAGRHNAPMRRLRAKAASVVYQSAFCRESAEKFLGPCRASSEIVLNPVDLDRFSPPTEAIPVEPLRLLSLGTHGYEERVFSALHCLGELRSSGCAATLTLAGRFLWPQADARVRSEIARLGLGGHVSLLPVFTQDEAPGLYRSHHLLIHPKYLDPCPTVVIESLACGLPVVGSASGGMPELVGPGCGELVPAPLDWGKMITPSGAELADCIRRLLPGLAAASTSARAWAEARFDAGAWVEKHREIFGRVLSGR